MTERSGTMRRVAVAVLMPGPACHDGRLHSVDTPPPPEPQPCAVQLSFQTV